jgi:hypothetical protein
MSPSVGLYIGTIQRNTKWSFCPQDNTTPPRQSEVSVSRHKRKSKFHVCLHRTPATYTSLILWQTGWWGRENRTVHHIWLGFDGVTQKHWRWQERFYREVGTATHLFLDRHSHLLLVTCNVLPLHSILSKCRPWLTAWCPTLSCSFFCGLAHILPAPFPSGFLVTASSNRHRTLRYKLISTTHHIQYVLLSFLFYKPGSRYIRIKSLAQDSPGWQDLPPGCLIPGFEQLAPALHCAWDQRWCDRLQAGIRTRVPGDCHQDLP